MTVGDSYGTRAFGICMIIFSYCLYRVLDHDTYSAHDAIGKVYIDLNPLLVKESPSVITGWFPIYDTMHGMIFTY
jgi:hypothetical protein